jgi:hypothetical protein
MMGNVLFFCADCGIEFHSPNALSFTNAVINLIFKFGMEIPATFDNGQPGGRHWLPRHCLPDTGYPDTAYPTLATPDLIHWKTELKQNTTLALCVVVG